MRIAMIGIKAIPARFGGFETAVDELSRGLVRRGHDVRVYNRSGMTNWEGDEYEGVKLTTFPTVRSKNLSTIVHAFLATFHVMCHPVDVVHYFTTGTTVFAPLPRLLGMKVVCSVDGTDWQRGKWGFVARSYLRLSEWLAARFCHGLVSDSRDVMRYYEQRYNASSSCIAYGMREYRSQGSEWLNHFNIESREYVLFVGRLVPENNIHLLIRAFEQTDTRKKLVIVGDDPWEKDYIRQLKSTRDPRVIFCGGVYGEGYAQLEQHAYLFVLPDEVGGTHPALVEAMGYGNCVLVNDTPSNLEVIGEAGFSYSGQERERHLYQQLQMLLSQPQLVEVYRRKAFERARQNFRWDMVVADHELFYKNQFCRQDTTSSTQHGRSPEALFISTAKKSSLRGDLKRAIDIAGATVGLLLLAPIFLVISIIVALSSPGPVFYRWKVVGKDGRNFVSYKFRSMFQDADERKAELLNNNEMSGPVFKMTADPRITPIGRFLRKYSVDEIPQLWSVLKGDMSLVGPRPPLQSEYEQFSERQKLKLQVKPGMTCLWQVKGRNEIANFDDWVRLDLEYINNWSLSLDFKILMSTIPAVLFGKGR